MPQLPQSLPAPDTTTRWLLSLVTVSLGGYLVVQGVSGLPIQLLFGGRMEASVGALLILQLLFALAVTVLGFFFAPAPLARRSIAAAVVVAVAILVVVLQVVRLTARLGKTGLFLSFTIADVFVMLTLALGLAWLIVRSRPGLSFVALALVIILALVHWGLLINGIDSATAQILMLVLSAIVVAAIGWGGVLTSRMLGTSSSADPNSASPQPQAPSAQNDRPAERGPVI